MNARHTLKQNLPYARVFHLHALCQPHQEALRERPSQKLHTAKRAALGDGRQEVKFKRRVARVREVAQDEALNATAGAPQNRRQHHRIRGAKFPVRKNASLLLSLHKLP
jgi:HPt (histidine-containing phosphotransfer) domain-containing protein